MKRLFGLIGFTFLFVLSAVFYSDFNEIVFAIIGSLGVLSVAVGIFLIVSKKINHSASRCAYLLLP